MTEIKRAELSKSQTTGIKRSDALARALSLWTTGSSYPLDRHDDELERRYGFLRGGKKSNPRNL